MPSAEDLEELRRLGILAAPEPAKPPTEITSTKTPATTILGVNLVSLVTMAPLNPVVRTQIQAIIRKPVPDELKDPDKIFEWVENNWDGKWPTKSPAKPGDNRITILVTALDTAFGHCNYKEYRSGREYYVIPDEEVLEAVEAAIDDEEGITGAVAQLEKTLGDMVRGDPPEMSADETNHYDEEQDETDDFEWQVRGGSGALRDALITYLHARHPGLEGRLRDQEPF